MTLPTPPMSLIDYLAQMENPFAAAVVTEREIYGPEIVDVDSIHREARVALREGIVRAGGVADGADGDELPRGRRPHFLAITGEAGDGKSHLLAWLARQRFCTYHFIAVPPLPDPTEPFRHALRHTLACLRRPRLASVAAPASTRSQATSATTQDLPRLAADPGGFADCPLGRLVWESLYLQALDLLEAAQDGRYEGAVVQALTPLCEDAEGRPRGAAAFAAAASPALIREGLLPYMLALPMEHPIDAAVRTVLCQYADPALRSLCAAWLAGEEVGEAEQARLGVKQALDSEAAARRVLTALGRLTAAPLVLCFDQIEGITDRLHEAGLRALIDLIREMYTQGGATCQVVTCQTGTWASFADRLLRQLPGRALEVPLMRLQLPQIRELLLARLQGAFAAGPARPFPTYPFTEDEITSLVRDGGVSNARAALRLFESEFERRRDRLVQPGKAVNASQLPPPVTDDGVVAAALAEAERAARASYGDSLPGQRASQVRAVFKELWDGLKLQKDAPIQVVSCDPIMGGGLRVCLQPAGDVRRTRVALELSNADPGPAVVGAVGRILRQVTDGRAEVALLLREEGLPLAQGAQRPGISIEAQLAKSGGVLWLPEEDLVELLALERVLHAASSGELHAGPRVLGRPAVLGHLLTPGGTPRAPRVIRRLFARLGLVVEEHAQTAPPEAETAPELPAGSSSGPVRKTLPWPSTLVTPPQR